MNELQIRITAEVQQFQAAMAKVETRLQKAEGILKKAQNSADKYRGSMATLAGQLKRGEVSQEQYNKGISKLSNGLLKQQDIINNSTREVDRLSKSYKNLNTRSLVQSQTQLSKSTQNLTRNTAGANGVAIEFNRIIQDAPFGIMGIGNNIQQLAGNFSNLAKKSTSTGAAVKSAITSMLTPANLALLAISALTAAWTAYNMGAFDFLKTNEKAKKSLKELADEINNASSKTSVESANISALRSVIEDETLSREKRLGAVQRLQDKYPEIFGNADKEKLLNGQLIGSYDLLTKAIIQRAEASLAEERIPQLNKEKQVIDSQLGLLKDQLQTEKELLNTRSKFVGQGDIFSEFDLAQARIRDTEKEIKNLGTSSAGLQINIDGFTQSIVDYQSEFVNLLEPLSDSTNKATDSVKANLEAWTDTQWQTAIDNQEELIKTQRDLDNLMEKRLMDAVKSLRSPEPIDVGVDAILDPKAFEEVAEQLDTVKLKTVDTTAVISTAFSGMSFQISEALGISNRNLRAFVGTLVSSTPKIIGALMAQAKASNAAASLANKGNLAQAKGNAIVSATSAAKGLGPVGLALLPVFIAGALALIGGAFNKGGGGGGGGAVATGSPQSFGNASIPQPTRQSLSDQSSRARPSTNSGRLEAVVTGDQIRFVLDQSGRRSGRG